MLTFAFRLFFFEVVIHKNTEAVGISKQHQNKNVQFVCEAISAR